MANVNPFAACLALGEQAARVATLPYDVMNRSEAAAMAADNPVSFLRVTRSEIELPAGLSAYDPAVYARGRENWQKIKAVALHKESTAHYYVYSLVMQGRRQTGVVAAASVADYQAGIVRRHERTRQEKEDDRTRHISTLRAQTGPVFLTYRDSADVDAITAEAMQTPPLFDFTAGDGIRHTGWRVPAFRTAALQQAFAAVPRLYIADGHHRAASAARTCAELQGAGTSGQFLSVIFPAGQLQILAYNRLVADLNGLDAIAFLAGLAEVGAVSEAVSAVPAQAGQVCFYMQKRWRTLTFKGHPSDCDPIGRLDVSKLQDRVLAPLLGIDDPRTSRRIDFVGGIRGTGELEKRVDNGEAAIAFSLVPTSLDELMAIADCDGIMPPKSTWFEPKLRDGLFVHEI